MVNGLAGKHESDSEVIVELVLVQAPTKKYLNNNSDPKLHFFAKP